jgi:hypothetical protein
MKKLKLLIASCALFLGGMSVSAQTWTGNEPTEGTFFLYNVGAGKFINNGDPSQRWGTNAYLQAGFGLDFKLELNNGAYNLNTNVSNGGDSHYLATSTWCDGGPTPWTFTAVDGETNTYTISNGESYLVANAALNDISYTALTNDNKSWWKLVSLDDFKAAMRNKAYSATDPMDVSVFIQGRSFVRNDGRNSSWATNHNEGNWTWIGSWNGGSGDPLYFGNEAWNNIFSVSQTIQNLPDGTYEVQCSGFGTNGTTFIFGNSTSKAIQTDNTTDRGSSKEAKWQAIQEDNAFAGQTTGKFTLSGGTLNLGIKRETNKGGDWAVWDEFRLYYYGLDLSEFAATLSAAVSAAQALEGTIPTAAYNALAQIVNENNKQYSTASDYTAAANAIENATNTAKALQANFARYNNVKTAALAISANLNTSTPDAAVNEATTNEAIDAAVATLRNTFLAELSKLTIPTDPGYIDVTAVMMDNASVSENIDYWTISNLSSSGGSAGVCNYGECEFYNRNFKFYQTLALTPGTWEFGVTGFHRAGNHKTYFYADEDKILIPGVDRSEVNTMEQAKAYFDSGKGKVALKFLVETAQDIEIGIDNQDTETDKWTIFRDFTLKYCGELDYSVYETQWSEAVAAAEAALQTYEEFDRFVTTEKDALTTAKADVPTPEGKKAGYVEKIGALIDATAAYIAASQKFESAKTAILKAKAIKEAHNFASTAAIETFENAIKAVSDKYDAGTLTQEEAATAGVTLGTAVTDNRVNPNGAAVNYLEDGFGLNDYGQALVVNTWSVEGENDGSAFTVPFYEYWVSDASSLSPTTWTGTLTNLPNGLYKVSTLVRVRAKSGVDATEASGISINVNEGEPKDVTTGTRVNDNSPFKLASFEAEGLVKNGELKFNVVVDEETNISWLSFKNVKYTKVRDLLPEELIIATTDDYAALNSAINSHAIGFDKDEYAPYNNVEAMQLLAAAQAINQEVTNEQSVVQAATAALTGATWTKNDAEVNAIFDGSFEYDYSGQTGNVNPIGWQRVKGAAADGYNVRYMNGSNAGLAATSSGKALFTKQSAYYGYADGYTMPLKAETYYKITFVYGGWGDCKKDGYVSMAAPDGSSVTLSATDLPVDATNADADVNAWKSYTAIFKTGDAGDYVLGLRKKNNDTSGQSQYVYGDIKIVRASATDLKDALLTPEYEKALAQGQAFVNNIGTGVFQIPESEAISFGQAGLAAKAVIENASATIDQVMLAIENLKVAEEAFANAELNAPDENKKYNILVATPNHEKAGNAVVIVPGKTGENNPTGYALNANFAVNKNLNQAVTFKKVSGNLYTISFQTAEGTTYMTYGTTNGSAAGWSDSQIQATANAENKGEFLISATATENVFNIYNTLTNSTIACQAGGNIYTEAGNAGFSVAEASETSITINTKAAGYGTIILPFNAELPNGLIAYTCAEANGNKLTLVEATALEANKPYILEGAGEWTLTGDAQGAALSYTEGLLTGVYADTDAPVGSYVLQNKKESGVGFYVVVEGDGKVPTVGPNHIYLTVPSAEGVRAFYFDGTTTGIDAINALANGEATIYNTNGVQLPRLQKGMNIIKMNNGATRKIMVK